MVSHVTWKHIVLLGTCPHKHTKVGQFFHFKVQKGPYATLIKLGVWGESTHGGGRGGHFGQEFCFLVHFVFFGGNFF
jgi:hypothetical protein